ncbi:type 3 dihydrofolate reductase [Pseudoalteromonas denitrificans]|uniref:Dihydrofolate reductase n=1 Tax=Pseudoalteromonas denitrificans DSM 6059 TaxID=1123010 RepID=A0A1I1DZ53_9GAMM|nr:type 3 dihydrofolate reductase [Pseudoalteromonas denitrificans]SFB80077.1 dihydrofolate reductase [Pseudoalteromonas denitrificans DSM 6059]
MMISMIAAMAKNRVIGKNNKMPWHLPADLKHFKAVTLGKPIIMGRKTFESIGRPLPGRKNIVISRDLTYKAEGIEVAATPAEALDIAGEVPEVMIIGGGHVYDVFLPLCNCLYLTHIDLDVEGDTQFPDYEAHNQWNKLEVKEHKSDSSNPYNYTFITYSN